MKDLPGTRAVLKLVATAGNVYFLLAMGLLGAVGAIGGFYIVQTEGPGTVLQIGENHMLMTIGFLSFALFFPWFSTLYFARHLLISIERLEGGSRQTRPGSEAAVEEASVLNE